MYMMLAGTPTAVVCCENDMADGSQCVYIHAPYRTLLVFKSRVGGVS